MANQLSPNGPEIEGYGGRCGMNSGTSSRYCGADGRGARARGAYCQGAPIGAGGGNMSFEMPNMHDAPVQAGAAPAGFSNVDRSAGRHPSHGLQMLTLTSADALTGRASNPIMKNRANITRPPRRLVEDDVPTDRIIPGVVLVKWGEMERRAAWRME